MRESSRKSPARCTASLIPPETRHELFYICCYSSKTGPESLIVIGLISINHPNDLTSYRRKYSNGARKLPVRAGRYTVAPPLATEAV